MKLTVGRHLGPAATIGIVHVGYCASRLRCQILAPRAASVLVGWVLNTLMNEASFSSKNLELADPTQIGLVVRTVFSAFLLEHPTSSGDFI